MKSMDFLEKELLARDLGSVEVEWKRMGNTAAMREAMLARDLDIGFAAIPPFLIGKDSGMDWRIISGLSESPVALITPDSSLRTISDLTKDHRIILPQPGSIQHILLAMLAEKETGDARAFDDRLLAMSHPDGVTALISGKGKELHFTAPPYMQEELAQEGFQILADGEEAFGGPFTFIVGICPERVYERKEVYQAFKAALTDSILYMEENPEESTAILMEAYSYDEESLKGYLAEEQMRYTTEVRGIETFASFMSRSGFLKTEPDMDSLYWKDGK
jgi:NitT/TauT family transport system substrate-binding protein